MTKAIQWDYPNVEEKAKKEGDIEGGGEEMDLCDTPPHLSPSEADKATGKSETLYFQTKILCYNSFFVLDEPPLTPPPPIISDTADASPPSPTPPPPPQISFCKEEPTSKSKKNKKRKTEEVSSSSEGINFFKPFFSLSF